MTLARSVVGSSENAADWHAQRQLLEHAVLKSAMRGFTMVDSQVLVTMAKAPAGLAAACAKLELHLRGAK